MRLKHVAVGMGMVWLWTMAGGGSVYGQTAPASSSGKESSFRLGKDLSLTIGLDLWVNQWSKSAVPTEDYLFFDRAVIRSIDSGDNVTQLSAWGVGLIPNVTLTYKNFFLSSSYMWTPEYDFGKYSDILSVQLVEQPQDRFAVTHQSSQTASRQEVDLTAGYFPLDWLGVAIGYKGIFLDFEQKEGRLSIGDISRDLEGLKATYSYHGPIFGVLASAKIDERFSLLGNAFGGYLFAACDFDLVGGGTPRECSVDNSPYAASKIVVRYAITPQIAATFGYRIQIINNPSDKASTAIDLTHGPVLGVNYRF